MAEAGGAVGTVAGGAAAPEVHRGLDGEVVASLLAGAQPEVLDLLDPARAWGRPVAAERARPSAEPAPGAVVAAVKGGAALGEGVLVRTVPVTLLLAGRPAGFGECAVVRRAPAAEHRACRVCWQTEGELLDGCACRGTVRYVCSGCLLECWSFRAASAGDLAETRCGLCHQQFTGKAREVLLRALRAEVQKIEEREPEAPTAAEEHDRCRAIVSAATALWQQGNYVEAAALFRQAVAKLEATDWAKSDALLFSAQHNLSLVLYAQGDLEQAQAHVRIARAGFTELLGAEHLLALKTAHNEAMIAEGLGNLAEALRGYEAVLEARQRVLGAEHQDTLKTCCNLGLVLSKSGDDPGAEQLLQRAVGGLERSAGRRHPLTLAALQNLSLVLARRRPVPMEAEELAREAAEGRLRSLGPEHPETMESRRDLAAVLEATGKASEAEEALRQALAGTRRVFGPGHQTTKGVVRRLRELLEGAGRAAEAQRLLEEEGRVEAAREAPPIPEPPAERGRLALVVLSLFVAAPWRRRGLGRAAVAHWRSLGRALRAEVLEASVPAAALDAQAFLRACGLEAATSASGEFAPRAEGPRAAGRGAGAEGAAAEVAAAAAPAAVRLRLWL